MRSHVKYTLFSFPGTIIKELTQWLERGAFPMCGFESRSGAGFSEIYHVSPLSILGHYFDVVFLGNTLYSYMLHLTQV